MDKFQLDGRKLDSLQRAPAYPFYTCKYSFILNRTCDLHYAAEALHPESADRLQNIDNILDKALSNYIHLSPVVNRFIVAKPQQ